MKVELAIERSAVKIKRECQIAQACGKQGREDALATPAQKVAASGIDWMRVDKMTRLLPPTQRKPPDTARGTENLTLVPGSVKARRRFPSR
jgi:hypothetical protein